MNEKQEKALWDFVRAFAESDLRTLPYDEQRIRRSARALLSVLAEEAPPVKEPPKVMWSCGCVTTYCERHGWLGTAPVCGLCGHPVHEGPCPPNHLHGKWTNEGAAPAPKQEKPSAVEDTLTRIFDRMAHSMTAATRARIREMLATAIKAVREERAASEDRIAHVKAMADQETAAWRYWSEEKKAENASLRERVAQYKLGEEMNGALAAERIDRIHRALAAAKGEQAGRLFQVIRILEGKGEGTEATK